MGCPLCGKNTDSMWLKFSRKHMYMCHRKGLPPGHRFRGKKRWFDGKAEQGRRVRILTGRDISQNLRHFNNEFGNVKRPISKRKRVISTDIGSESEGLSNLDHQREKEITSLLSAAGLGFQSKSAMRTLAEREGAS
ncbi:hypothetical protein Bca4012_010495 [Brassica carinata]